LNEFRFELGDQPLDRWGIGDSPTSELAPSVVKQTCPVRKRIGMDRMPPQPACASDGRYEIVLDAAVQLHCPSLAEHDCL
jgi:hypothetical protein